MPETAARKIKIACPKCGQKLDITELPPFARVLCPTCALALIVPKWFDNYLLEEPEGIGGMATVYRALDIALDREVAIKILNPDLMKEGVSPELFLHEARTAATINHHAVVPIYSCGEWGGSTYIVMQYMGGGTLEQRLKRANGQLPILETVRWVRDICDGMDNARAHNIVHHDVKPANILLDLESNAKIADFGLAQVVSGKKKFSAEEFLDSSKMWLSPHYVSPEKVLTGKEGPDGDIYSLGATFYHLLTGRPPFQSDDTEELVRMRTERDPAPPITIRPEIGLALSSIIMDMMSRNPVDRPAYKQIIDRINEALKAAMRSTSPVERLATSTPAPRRLVPVRRVFHVSTQTLRSKYRFRSSHVSSLLLLLFVMLVICAFVLLPVFVDKRELYDHAPVLSGLYGDIQPEKFDFAKQSGADYSSPLIDTELAFADASLPMETRLAAAWNAGALYLLSAQPDAISRITDMEEQLRSAAALSGKPMPSADYFCLSVISRRNHDQPPVYFSGEQQARILIGRFLRDLYDLDPSGADGRIPTSVKSEFGAVRNALAGLPQDSWVVRFYQYRLADWEAVLSGGRPSRRVEPLFERLRQDKKDGNVQN